MPLVTPTLTTNRLTLRPISAADRDAIVAIQSDAAALEFWDEPAWTDAARFDRFLARSAAMAQDDEGIRLAIVRRDGGEVVGWCALNGWNPTYRTVGLCYSLARHAWGQGIGTETARALVGWAFTELGVNRVQAETDTRNHASARILGKLGFTREGTLREDCVVDGVVSDSWVFGLLRREWTTTR
ncbi:GNAT family N-acetyltransferase [Arsenicicoccus dermatophilus]|uniref:GNAT family N-acetyltransferase n=1 Tax=Arsenicicoccus dermatophilus TaxID=1076331 RepID=UPI00391726F5